MKSKIIDLILAILLLGSAACHFWEYRKIREFSDAFTLQSSIELKRTSLMVIYQNVLQNMARELDAMKEKMPNENLELNFEGDGK